MRIEARLERFDGFTEEVTHADVGGWQARSPAGKAFVDRVVLARFAHPRFDKRHVRVPVILVIEPSIRCIRVHHTHFDHFPPPGGALNVWRLERWCARWPVRRKRAYVGGKRAGEPVGRTSRPRPTAPLDSLVPGRRS